MRCSGRLPRRASGATLQVCVATNAAEFKRCRGAVRCGNAELSYRF